METLSSSRVPHEHKRPKAYDMSKDTLGEFEALVLLAALRLGREAYGLSITNEIVETARRPAVRASVYVTLRRLEQRGLISTRREPPESAPHGKPRRLVTVEPRGVELLRASRRSLQSMWSGLEAVLEEAP
jgi:DNA-binding PadR family transcriptional regulator